MRWGPLDFLESYRTNRKGSKMWAGAGWPNVEGACASWHSWGHCPTWYWKKSLLLSAVTASQPDQQVAGIKVKVKGLWWGYWASASPSNSTNTGWAPVTCLNSAHSTGTGWLRNRTHPQLQRQTHGYISLWCNWGENRTAKALSLSVITRGQGRAREGSDAKSMSTVRNHSEKNDQRWGWRLNSDIFSPILTFFFARL